MRSSARIAAAAGVLWIASALPGAEPFTSPPPGAELRKLDDFAGEWEAVEGIVSSSEGRGERVTGHRTCEWLPGGFFLVCRDSWIGEAEPIEEMSILGFDSAGKVYTSYAIRSTGESIRARGTLDEQGCWSWDSEEKSAGGTVQTRVLIKPIGKSALAFKVVKTSDGKAWTPVLDGRYRRTRK